MEQAQIFTPTPSTLSTVIYATGINPYTEQPVFVEKDPERKRMQKALLLAHLDEQHALVRKALALCQKEDLFPAVTGASTGRSRRPPSRHIIGRQPQKKRLCEEATGLRVRCPFPERRTPEHT